MEEKKLQSMLNSLQAQQSFGKEYAKSLQTKLVAGTGTNVETLKLNHKEAAIRARQRQVLKYHSAHDCKETTSGVILVTADEQTTAQYCNDASRGGQTDERKGATRHVR